MATSHFLSLTFFLLLLFSPCILCADPLAFSPSPAPQSGDDSASPSPVSGAPGSPLPSPSDSFSSPPSPPPSPTSVPPSPSPAPSPSNSNSPAPAPTVASDISRAADIVDNGGESSGRMNGGQKAGIAVGVIAGACLVGFGGMLYRKRQQNIRCAQYGFAARKDIL